MPYLKAEPEQAARWRQRLDTLVPRGYRRIGLVWAGRPTHGNDSNRSMGLSSWALSLMQENRARIAAERVAQAELGKYFGAAPLINLGAEITDFTDTMAILARLDRLVTVDTSVVHLAGAMGRPVSVLVPYACDWRWLLRPQRHALVSTATLCRQAAPGDWDSAMEAVLGSLRG